MNMGGGLPFIHHPGLNTPCLQLTTPMVTVSSPELGWTVVQGLRLCISDKLPCNADAPFLEYQGHKLEVKRLSNRIHL